MLEGLRDLDRMAGGRALQGLPVIVSHIKYSLTREQPQAQMVKELEAGNDLGVRFIIPEQGNPLALPGSLKEGQWPSRRGATAPARCSRARRRRRRAARGWSVTNHPLGSAAGMEMLAAGGNAVDAAVAAQFALTVVEPMMVGLIGGTTCHIRRADGSHVIVDGMSAVPLAGTPDMFRPVAGAPPEVFDVEGRENQVGPKAVAAPGSLLAWCHALRRYGTMSLADVMQPAIRHAARGFTVTPYLSDCIDSAAADLAKDKLAAARLLPGGRRSRPARGWCRPTTARRWP